ncbi:Flp pilus assembly protein CpaB [Oricola thermophila]|uniref:Flp pilus assembly protein CpaB n=1 Tax=Oricola thermophila TaxID=2742145 RepID=A0A6N1VB57_9HYPH|nr:Flp pilus assembly protein CpaB [Oricola thermophila]QKV17783.1 Flp pilus assembly protein CpaB [Oricola thermophila]
MNKKFLVMGGIAIVFGGMSIVAADFWLKSNVRTVVETVETQGGDASEVEFTTIVVAAEPMRYGALIDPGMVKEIPWPKDSLPKGVFRTVDDMLSEGERTALAAIEANEPILVGKVTDPGERATLSRRIEDGMRAVTIRVDDISGVAGFVVPGDRVDIALTRTFTIKGDANDTSAGEIAPIEVSPVGDRTFTGDPDSFVATTIILEKVKVLSIDQIADERQSDPVVVRAVTLEVDTAGAKVLAAAQSAGALSLQLRSAGDVDDDELAMPSHGIDDSFTSSFSTEPVASTAKVTVRRNAEVQTYDVRNEGAVQ